MGVISSKGHDTLVLLSLNDDKDHQVFVLDITGDVLVSSTYAELISRIAPV